jgi:hypothetical protein
MWGLTVFQGIEYKQLFPIGQGKVNIVLKFTSMFWPDLTVNKNRENISQKVQKIVVCNKFLQLMLVRQKLLFYLKTESVVSRFHVKFLNFRRQAVCSSSGKKTLAIALPAAHLFGSFHNLNLCIFPSANYSNTAHFYSSLRLCCQVVTYHNNRKENWCAWLRFLSLAKIQCILWCKIQNC